MQNKLRLSALDGYVLIDGNNVAVMNDIDPAVQISLDEWETLREKFRFDDAIDYEKGETPMTVFQFRSCVELFRETKALKAEKERLLNLKEN